MRKIYIIGCFIASGMLFSSEQVHTLQLRAIASIASDVKKNIYKCIRKNVRIYVQELIKDISQDMAYELALHFFKTTRSAISDVELLILEAFIEYVPSFSLTMEVIEKNYPFMNAIVAKSFMGIEAEHCGQFLCSYEHGKKELDIHIDGIDYYPVLSLANIYALIDRYLERYNNIKINKVLFDITLSRYNERNNFMMRTLSKIKKESSLLLSANSYNKNVRLPSSIRYLKKINELYCSDNETIEIDSSVSYMKQLQVFVVGYENKVIFQETFNRMLKLKSFMLQKQNENRKTISFLPAQVLHSMPNLTHLHLEDRFENMQTLLYTIASLSQLKHLYIEPKYDEILPHELKTRFTSEERGTSGYFKLKSLRNPQIGMSGRKSLAHSSGAITYRGSY